MKELDVSPLCHKITCEPQTVVEGLGHFDQHVLLRVIPLVMSMDTPNLERYVVSLDAGPPPS